MCPKCGERPKFWVFHRENGSRMCKLYSRRYSLVDLRSFHVTGNALSYFTGYKCMNDVEHWIKGVWCRACNCITFDNNFVRNLVNVAKQLEKTGYVDYNEW